MGNQILTCFGRLTWLFSQGRPPHTLPGGIEGTIYIASFTYSSTLIREAQNFPSSGTAKDVHK